MLSGRWPCWNFSHPINSSHGMSAQVMLLFLHLLSLILLMKFLNQPNDADYRRKARRR